MTITERENFHLFVGTWNVRGTFEDGKLRHLVNDVGKYKFDTVTLQKTNNPPTKLRKWEIMFSLTVEERADGWRRTS